MLASEVLTTAPVVLYTVELSVELRIEEEGMASIFHYLLQEKTCSCTAVAALQTLWIGITFCLPTKVRVNNLTVKKKPYVSGH